MDSHLQWNFMSIIIVLLCCNKFVPWHPNGKNNICSLNSYHQRCMVDSFFCFLPPASEGWREVIFSLCVSVHTWGGGGPDPALDGGGYPNLGQGGYPNLEGGYPISGGVPQPWMGGTPSPGGYPISGYPSPGIASTCYGYTVGGVPLVFTQEDFLFFKNFWRT